MCDHVSHQELFERDICIQLCPKVLQSFCGVCALLPLPAPIHDADLASRCSVCVLQFFACLLAHLFVCWFVCSVVRFRYRCSTAHVLFTQVVPAVEIRTKPSPVIRSLSGMPIKPIRQQSRTHTTQRIHRSKTKQSTKRRNTETKRQRKRVTKKQRDKETKR